MHTLYIITVWSIVMHNFDDKNIRRNSSLQFRATTRSNAPLWPAHTLWHYTHCSLTIHKSEMWCAAGWRGLQRWIELSVLKTSQMIASYGITGSPYVCRRTIKTTLGLLLQRHLCIQSLITPDYSYYSPLGNNTTYYITDLNNTP